MAGQYLRAKADLTQQLGWGDTLVVVCFHVCLRRCTVQLWCVFLVCDNGFSHKMHLCHPPHYFH